MVYVSRVWPVSVTGGTQTSRRKLTFGVRLCRTGVQAHLCNFLFTHTHTQKKAQPGKTNKTFPGERACETEGRLYTCQLTSKHGIRYNRTTNTKKKASKLKQVSICMNTGRSCSDCFLRAALLSYCCYACQALCPCMVQ